MRCVHRCDFPQWKFSLYFLERVRDAEAGALAEPGTIESEAYLWSMKGATLELTHNHGSENDDNFSVWSGNSGSDLPADSPLHMAGGPIRGFGHIAFNVPDVYALSASLEADGVRFQKRPDEGRMKGLAFCLDPDGYWIELGARAHARARAPRPVLRARVPPPPPSPTPTPLGPSLPSASRSAGRRLRRADQPLADDDARQGRGEDEGVLHGRARPHARARDARAKRLLQLLLRQPLRGGALRRARPRVARGEGIRQAAVAARHRGAPASIPRRRPASPALGPPFALPSPARSHTGARADDEPHTDERIPKKFCGVQSCVSSEAHPRPRAAARAHPPPPLPSTPPQWR